VPIYGSGSSRSIYCTEHEGKDIEFYCLKDHILLCSLCVWDHSDHRSVVKVCTQKDINKYTGKLRESLDKMKGDLEENLEKSKQIMYMIENKERQMSSKEIIEYFRNVKRFLINPFFSPEDDTGRALKYIIEVKESFLMGSELVTDIDELLWLKGNFGKIFNITELIYKGTKDGFSA
jgi:hypothetical protein